MCAFFFQAEDGIRGRNVTGVQTCALPILVPAPELVAAALAFAEEIAVSAPQSIRAIRATMRQGLVERFYAATQWEAQEQEIGRASCRERVWMKVGAGAVQKNGRTWGR